MIIWFTGLSGSGKTTLARSLKKKLEKAGYTAHLVDGDIFRENNKAKNTFSRREILNNNYKIISYCESVHKNYDFVLVAVISPYEETRKRARKVFGKGYLEVFTDASMKTLKKRDPKRLYRKALAGEIKNLIGFSQSSPYERPLKPDLKINTGRASAKSSLEMISKFIKKRGGEAEGRPLKKKHG